MDTQEDFAPPQSLEGDVERAKEALSFVSDAAAGLSVDMLQSVLRRSGGRKAGITGPPFQELVSGLLHDVRRKTWELLLDASTAKTFSRKCFRGTNTLDGAALASAFCLHRALSKLLIHATCPDFVGRDANQRQVHPFCSELEIPWRALKWARQTATEVSCT